MRQFDVLENPDPTSRPYTPFLVVVQSHHLNGLETIFLAPMISDAQRAVNILDIEVVFRDRALVIAVAEAAGVPKGAFGRIVGSVAEHEDAIRRAFERMLGGF